MSERERLRGQIASHDENGAVSATLHVDQLRRIVAAMEKLENETEKWRAILAEFVEYMEYSNADEHLADHGYEYFERVKQAASGELSPEEVGTWKS